MAIDWTKVEDGLPEEHDSIFAKFYGSDHWDSAMFKRCSDVVLVAWKGGDGITRTATAHTVDGVWRFQSGFIKGTVTHWMPLPKPPET
ncbi:MAG: DUF551 domain-containing protein [Oscillospiraceae bacterium]|nr:DUF551 domain-containing protein [Oscillospiraceae bacterium]